MVGRVATVAVPPKKPCIYRMVPHFVAMHNNLCYSAALLSRACVEQPPMTSWSHPWFDSWSELTSSQPWQNALDGWWSQFSKQPASPFLQALEAVVDQSRSFFQLAEQLNGEVEGDPAADWQANLDRIFTSLKQTFDHPHTGTTPEAFWQMPLANWQRTVSSLSGLPGDWTGSEAGAKLDQFLSTPGLGYTRESQADQQEFTRLLLDYQSAYQKYASFFAEMNKTSLDRMRDRLLARVQDQKEPITSVRELYDLWVGCSEEVYAEQVLTDEYAQLHGELINAMMALKRHSGQMMDAAAGGLNMPTRKEIDTLHQRFQSARRSEHDLWREVCTMRGRESALHEQINELLDKVEKLERGASAKSATAKKKTKKTGAKTTRAKRS